MPHFFLFNQLTNKLVFAILYLVLNNYAALAQLVERFHGKEEVVGSSPTGGSFRNLEYSRFLFFAAHSSGLGNIWIKKS